MVDTITCLSEADLTEKFFEKLLLGAIDKAVDHEVITPPSSAGLQCNGSEQMPHYSQPSQIATYADTKYLQQVSAAGQYASPNLVERHSDPQIPMCQTQAAPSSTSIPQATPRYSPHLDRFQPQPEAPLPRHSTFPHESTELPIHPAPRSRTFGKAKEKSGWRPFS